MLRNVHAVVDGLKLYLEQTWYIVTQNKFYDDWKCPYHVSNVFVLIYRRNDNETWIKTLGRLKDSKVAVWGGIYNKLEKAYNISKGTFCRRSVFKYGNIYVINNL